MILPETNLLAPIGMYGHVVPLSGPLEYINATLPTAPLHYSDLYLIQYWQFFPYNDFNAPAGGGDHEGDWICLDLLVDRVCPYELRYIVHHHHGDNECGPTILGLGTLPLPTRPFPLTCNLANLVKVPLCYL